MADSRKCEKGVILAEKRDLYTARALQCDFHDTSRNATGTSMGRSCLGSRFRGPWRGELLKAALRTLDARTPTRFDVVNRGSWLAALIKEPITFEAASPNRSENSVGNNCVPRQECGQFTKLQMPPGFSARPRK